MKKTILSEKELKLLEDTITHYGVIASFDQISKSSTDKRRQSIRNFVSKLSKNGWLVRIKKGLYFVAGMESLGQSGLSIYKTAQLLCSDSYVSFEAALQYHGMFDQGLKVVSSVSRKRKKEKKIGNVIYKFIKAKDVLFYGFDEYRVENYLAKIAHPEKAILDILCFNRSLTTIDLVLEKLTEHKDDIDLDRLYQYAGKQSVGIKRIAGFLLDKAGINSDRIYNEIKNKRDCSHMVNGASKFNAKWRLYYDKFFDRSTDGH